jgi:hypothetical protein
MYPWYISLLLRFYFIIYLYYLLVPVSVHFGTNKTYILDTSLSYMLGPETIFISVPIVVYKRIILFQYLLLWTRDYFYFSTYCWGPATIFISVPIVVDQRLFLFQYLLLWTRDYFYFSTYCCVPDTIFIALLIVVYQRLFYRWNVLSLYIKVN